MIRWLCAWQREQCGGGFNSTRVLVTNYAAQRGAQKAGAVITQAYHSFHLWLGEG